MKEMRRKEDIFENEIALLERQLEKDLGYNKAALVDQLKLKKKESESIIEYKTKGAIIKSKVSWYNEGKKNSKYFLNLENGIVKEKRLRRLRTFALIVYAHPYTAHAVHVATPCYVMHERAHKGRNLFT